MTEPNATQFDPVENMLEQRNWGQSIAQWNQIRGRYTREDAVNAAAIARQYPNAGPDIVAGIARSGWRWDQTSISQIIAADQRETSGFQKRLTQLVGPVTRPVLAGFEEMYRQGVSRNFNWALNLTKGQGLEESRQNAGLGLPAQWALAKRRGEDPTLGQGILPGMHPDPLMAPGGGEQLQKFMEAGLSPQQAMSATEEWILDNVGYDVMNATRRDAETTMIHKTKNGETISYHANPGRAHAPGGHRGPGLGVPTAGRFADGPDPRRGPRAVPAHPAGVEAGRVRQTRLDLGRVRQGVRHPGGCYRAR